MYLKFINNLASIFYPLVNSMMKARWHNNPFVKQPGGSEEDYRKLWRQAKETKSFAVEELEKNLGFAVDSEWLNDLSLVTQISIKPSSPNFDHGRVLYSTLRAYTEKLNKGAAELTIVETGTARGFSSICMAKALKDANISGRIITFDVLPHNVKMFWNAITDHQQGPISRKTLIENWKDLVAQYIIFIEGPSSLEMTKIFFERVNFAFLDAVHTYKEVMQEFYYIKDKQLIGDIVIFDDYNPETFPGVVKAVNEICKKFSYDKKIIGSNTTRSYVIATKKNISNHQDG